MPLFNLMLKTPTLSFRALCLRTVPSRCPACTALPFPAPSRHHRLETWKLHLQVPLLPGLLSVQLLSGSLGPGRPRSRSHAACGEHQQVAGWWGTSSSVFLPEVTHCCFKLWDRQSQPSGLPAAVALRGPSS